MTHILIAVLRAVLAAGLLLAFNGPGSGDSGGPLLGDKHVLGLHAAPTGTLAGSEQPTN